MKYHKQFLINNVKSLNYPIKIPKDLSFSKTILFEFNYIKYFQDLFKPKKVSFWLERQEKGLVLLKNNIDDQIFELKLDMILPIRIFHSNQKGLMVELYSQIDAENPEQAFVSYVISNKLRNIFKFNFKVMGNYDSPIKKKSLFQKILDS